MLTAQILLSLLVLSCGPVLLWWRRDNVLGYLAAGVFVSAYLIPLAPTLDLYRLDHDTIRLYADILAVGALAFLGGLFLGGQVGARSPRKVPLTFAGPPSEHRSEAEARSSRPAMSERLVILVTTRARWIAAGGLLALVLAFALMGYVPFLAADRVSAKYGVGFYRAAFERGALVYRFGLAASAAILPIMLAAYWRRRRPLDLVLSVALVGGLLLSLSRDSAFFGPFVFAVAVLVERRYHAGLIAVLVVAASSVGALFSILFVQQGDQPDAIASRIAASTPDIRDHLGFLKGFETRPEPTYGRTVLAGLSLEKTEWDPATYALKTLTGISDLRDFASGGLRLPPPLWGYASFGWAGVAMFSAVAGFFAGWGFVKVRRLLTPALGAPGVALALAISAVFYEGTFGVLAEFYHLSSSVVVRLAVAVAVGVAVRVALTRRRGSPTPAPGPERRPAGQAAAAG